MKLTLPSAVPFALLPFTPPLALPFAPPSFTVLVAGDGAVASSPVLPVEEGAAVVVVVRVGRGVASVAAGLGLAAAEVGPTT